MTVIDAKLHPPWVGDAGGRLTRGDLVEVEIEGQDIDTGLAEQSKRARGDVLFDKLAYLGFAEMAGLGHARGLEESGVRGNVGVKARAGGCDHVDGDRLAGVFSGQLVNGALDAIDESLAGLGQVRSAGCSGVVAVRAGRRRAGMEVAIAGEALRQELGSDDVAVFEDEAPGGLVREDHAGDAGDQERIAEAEKHRGDERKANRCLPDGMLGRYGLRG